jgi:hypothetical protein
MNDEKVFEKHYRIAGLAKLWGLGRECVRQLVKIEPDVIGVKSGKKHAHTTWSVPESVARRIHAKLLNGA